MAEKEIDFEEQLRLEAEEKERKEREALGTYTDKDGCVYEFDEEKKAWFPKIDDDFIAQYQMNYGSSENVQPESAEKETSKTDEKSQLEDRYQQYWNYFNQQNTNTDNTGDGDGKEDASGENTSENKQMSEPPFDTNSEEYRKWYIQYCKYYYGYDYSEYYGVPEDEEEEEEVKVEGQTEEGQNQEDAKAGKGKKKGKRKLANPQPKEEPKWFDMDEEKNTNVYVSGLPSDITDDEYKEMMTKYGLVMFDPISKSPKLKLYKDENGEPKGDGRCCYIKLESVDLALKLLDGYNLRGSTIHVEKARFTMKGEFDPSKKRKKLSNKEKKKMKEKQQKLFDWRPERAVGGRKKGDKVVILKNMFKPTDFDEDPMLINELRDDVRTEASKFGEVKNVKIFDNHPEGVMSVSFKEPEEADACISAFNGRWFDKKVITAESWDGRTKYEIQESEAERDARLNKWEKFLENDEKKNSSSSGSSNVTEKETNSQQTKKTEVEEAGASDMSPQKSRDEAGSTSTSVLPSVTTGGASGSDHSTPN